MRGATLLATVAPFLDITSGTAPSQACFLGDTGIFESQPNGQFDFSKDYELKHGKTNPRTKEKLQNKGRIIRSTATLSHRNAGDYSDAWVKCSENKMAPLYLVKCFNNGTFEINGKSGDAITLPSCDPIGCDPQDLGVWNSKRYEKSDGCKFGHTKANGTELENDKNYCFRRCGENFEFKSKRKIKCICDFSTASCSYQIKTNVGWQPWDYIKPNGNVVIPTHQCPGVEPPTPKPTDPTTVPIAPPVATWSEWSAWGACSAGCGTGLQKRDRSCIDDTCVGDASESQSCVGPDGAKCPLGCKISYGDWKQTPYKTCKTHRGPDGYYIKKTVKCSYMTCEYATGTVTCECSKKGVCTLKHTIGVQVFAADSSVTDCKREFGGKVTGFEEKAWRWADGRRSTAQPESEVSGGPEYELMDVCYAHNAYTIQEIVNYIKGYKDLPFTGREELVTSITYGKVVEQDNGVLACRYANPKYPDFEELHEHYYQLSVKTGKMSWISSERFFKFEAPQNVRHHTGEFYHAMMVFMNNNFPKDCCSLEGSSDEKTHRALCRVQDNRDNKWYNGVTVEMYGSGDDSPLPGLELGYERHYFIFCNAFADDGTVLKARSHNYYFNKEKDHPNDLKSEYFVLGGPDGSTWADWSEWGECSKTCDDGYGRKRISTRQCLDKDGNAIPYKQGFGCMPKLKGGTLQTDTREGKCLPEQSMDYCPV